jgi:hypothetical protein
MDYRLREDDGSDWQTVAFHQFSIRHKDVRAVAVTIDHKNSRRVCGHLLPAELFELWMVSRLYLLGAKTLREAPVGQRIGCEGLRLCNGRPDLQDLAAGTLLWREIKGGSEYVSENTA